MRLPGDVNKPKDRAHFLTEAYISKFRLPIKKFPNYHENGLSNIYGLKAKSNGMPEFKFYLTLYPKLKNRSIKNLRLHYVNVHFLTYCQCYGIFKHTMAIYAWEPRSLTKMPGCAVETGPGKT